MLIALFDRTGQLPDKITFKKKNGLQRLKMLLKRLEYRLNSPLEPCLKDCEAASESSRLRGGGPRFLKLLFPPPRLPPLLKLDVESRRCLENDTSTSDRRRELASGLLFSSVIWKREKQIISITTGKV
uniref:Uncharacterized protein n=1 Tax=Romanomermis culicivorax TaxID=13658 RepID=A0A915HFY3_ROMCU